MAYTPMMMQYLEMKKELGDTILMFRLGDFYEMFFEDAKLVSRELELTLTGRDCGEAERAPMCGVPFHSVEPYIGRLVSRGYKVAICEQVEDPATAKGLVRREIVRIVTPGTVIENNLLNEQKNNYLACVYATSGTATVAFADTSTGEVSVTTISGSSYMERLVNELGVYAPSEVIFNLDRREQPMLSEYCSERLGALLTDRQAVRFAYETARTCVESHFLANHVDATLEDEGQICALGALISYICENQKCETFFIKSFRVYSEGQYLELDRNTRRNLELCETMRDKEKRGTLLWVLDHTKTSMGARMLRKWIEQPLLRPRDILFRQRAVETLTEDMLLRSELAEQFKNVLDIERLITRVVYGSANARDLVAVAESLAIVPMVRALLAPVQTESLVELREQLSDFTELTELISCAIAENPPFSVREGGMIRRGFHPGVDRLLDLLENSSAVLSELESAEKEKTGIKNLKIGYNRVFGYYIEVSKSNIADVPEDRYIRKQTLANAERYITEELKNLEATIMGASDKNAALQYELFSELREKVANQVESIRKTADALAQIDVLVSLAHVAVRNHYVCPEIDEGNQIIIKDGRHPVVEMVVKDRYFVPNDTMLDTAENRLILLTGPNMAGKSTYMRQVALITLMAQIGSFVPAQSARIGIVDKIFTRVGASDDLASGQSTFMLEMNEVAYILKNASARSLVIYDEIGRGTSTFDGMSIAQAVAEYTASKRIGARTLFATHYHELTALEGKIDGILNYHIAAKKKGGEVTFLRKIVRGGADDSYGIEVAQLAGVPKEVLRRAREVLAELEAGGRIVEPATTVLTEAQSSEPFALTFESVIEQQVAEILRKTDLNVLTPIEALNLIFTLKKQLEG